MCCNSGAKIVRSDAPPLEHTDRHIRGCDSAARLNETDAYKICHVAFILSPRLHATTGDKLLY